MKQEDRDEVMRIVREAMAETNFRLQPVQEIVSNYEDGALYLIRFKDNPERRFFAQWTETRAGHGYFCIVGSAKSFYTTDISDAVYLMHQSR